MPEEIPGSSQTEPFFQWSDEWLLGVDVIDRDHRELAVLVSELMELLLSGPGGGHPSLSEANAERARHLFVRLYDGMLRHFLTEERMMANTGFGQLQEHRREHQMLLAELKYYAQRMVESDRRIDLRSLLALRRWFVVHIMESDRCLADYLIEAGLAGGTDQP